MFAMTLIEYAVCNGYTTVHVFSRPQVDHRRRNVKPDTNEFPNYLPAKKLAN